MINRWFVCRSRFTFSMIGIVRKLIKKSPYWRGWLIDADTLLTDYRLSNYEMTSSEGHFFKHLELVPIKQTLDQIKDELKR